MKKRLLIYFKFFAFAPIINFLVFLLLFFRAYFLVEKFPGYGNPDPNNFEFIYSLYFISWFILVSSIVFFPILFFTIKTEMRIKLKYSFIYLIAFLVLFLLYRNETLNLKNWILD